MAEGLDLAGLDAPRPLPPELRERLESALLAAAGVRMRPSPLPGDFLLRSPGNSGTTQEEIDEGEGRAEDPFALDAPRPLPADARARLEAAMLAGAAGASTGPASPPGRPATTEEPPTPAPLRFPQRRPSWARPLLAAAAVIALLVGSLAVLDLGDRGAGPDDRDVTAAGPEATGTTVPPSTGPAVGIPSPTTIPAAEPSAPPTTRPSPPGRASSPRAQPPPPAPAAAPEGDEAPSGGATSGGEAAPAPAPEGAGPGSPGSDADPGPAPPFSSPSAPASATSGDQGEPPAASMAPGSGSAGPSPAQPSPSSPRAGAPAGPPLRIGIFGGDAAQEAGFRAYVDLLNREGGVRGRPVELVTVGPGSSDASTLVTVNLSSRPLATPGGPPAWATGPLLETLSATEDLLPAGGRVFSFASVPERQAHLAVDAVFPEPAPGARAVVYAATDGPYAGAVAGAFREVLTARRVAVTTVTYDPTRPPALLSPADAAFVSLDPPAAAAFTRQAAQEGYRPTRGIAGVASLFDPALLAELPDGTRVVSPYQVPGGAEGDALRAGAGSPSAGALHGWASAKILAVALWRSGADTPAATLSALEGMTGYDSGLAPPYETRPQTRSRTPEGVVFEVRARAFVAQGGFRRDLH